MRLSAAGEPDKAVTRRLLYDFASSVDYTFALAWYVFFLLLVPSESESSSLSAPFPIVRYIEKRYVKNEFSDLRQTLFRKPAVSPLEPEICAIPDKIVKCSAT